MFFVTCLQCLCEYIKIFLSFFTVFRQSEEEKELETLSQKAVDDALSVSRLYTELAKYLVGYFYGAYSFVLCLPNKYIYLCQFIYFFLILTPL